MPAAKAKTVRIEKQLEGLLTELRELRVANRELREENGRLAERAGFAEATLKNVRRKCEILERKPAVLTGLDEEWLYKHDVQIRCSRKLSGARRCVVRARNRTWGEVTVEDPKEWENKSLVKTAIYRARKKLN